MQKVYAGIRQFHQEAFPARRSHFESLAQGQRPELLLVTCSDSRIDPSLVLQTDPGDVFVIRNAGNFVAPYGEGSGAEAATIQYGIEVLGIPDLAVCGHSHCGAMAAVLDPPAADALPAVRDWLRFGEPAIDRMDGIDGIEDRALRAVAANVLVQLDHLRTHPSVARAEDAGELTLHGWVYRFETGEVLEVEPDGALRPLAAPSRHAADGARGASAASVG
jgi:carbonic anhydrase